MVSEAPQLLREEAWRRAEPYDGHRLRFDITEWLRIKKGLSYRVYACLCGEAQAGKAGRLALAADLPVRY
jgi:hypothetical protein